MESKYYVCYEQNQRSNYYYYSYDLDCRSYDLDDLLHRISV